ncbi:hypothetical protein EJK48_0523 [Moraxella catarrhalis]|uniref:Uncharacterized protein n=1 Tax=Moraxella catarrhalis TaxID=480 RepID=A0A3Q9GFK6_MORCA|nr:hypothetical protein MCR_0493 [Moraxella catarrhalis BBH18]AZQ93019.1 hypothetical protein EJK53_0520 [Moraxella catarrhalis]AZQ94856.1 hypothetical protein EJK48_0523 [Moraxella catarrhalis]EKF84028.1 hypothetical protein MCRH_0544 [Moraxella catarrhalis RH4]RUO14581.1 hypothetical protein EJK49_1726 [Moraxella catarrhalis]
MPIYRYNTEHSSTLGCSFYGYEWIKTIKKANRIILIGYNDKIKSLLI